MYIGENHTLLERATYAPESFTSDQLCELILDLQDWQQVADTPDDVKAMESDLDDWQTMRFCRDYNCKTPDEVDERIAEFTRFFGDVLCEVEEYGGRCPCATPDDILPIVSETFAKADEYKTTLINLREAIKVGEALEYLADLIPDDLGE